jgi:hypothetical protein
MASERTVTWVSCARCAGDMLIDPASIASLAEGGWSPARSLPGEGPVIYCAKCRPIVDAEEARKPVVPGARCVLAMHPRGPFSDLFITAVDGDRVTVCVLGLGGVEPGRARELLAAWWPAGLWDRDPLTFGRSELRMRGL